MLTRSHRTRSSLCAAHAQHGGGYSYRICPASSPLTEACFQSHPLDFVPSKSALLLPDGSRIPITPLHVSTGTQPAGSTWSRIPIPPTDLGPRCLPGPKDNASTPHGCTPADKRMVIWDPASRALKPLALTAPAADRANSQPSRRSRTGQRTKGGAAASRRRRATRYRRVASHLASLTC